MSRYSALLLAVLLSANLAAAQLPTSAPAAAASAIDSSADAAEAYVVEELVTKGGYQADGSGDFESRMVVRVTSQAGLKDAGLLRVPYAKATQKLEIGYVRVRKPNGKVIETPVDSAEDMAAEITRAAPEYSDLREKHIAVRGLNVGDTLEYSFSVHESPDLIPNRYWYEHNFERDAVVRLETLELSFPAGAALKHKSRRVQPSIREEAGRKIYTWKFSNPKVVKEAPVRVAPPPDVLISNIQSWQELGGWWASVLKPQSVSSPEIQEKMASLAPANASKDQKLQNIYSFVASRFRYIGVSFGIGRLQPHPASETFQNGYGDCKDKHALLTAMVRSAGAEVHSALLNTEREIEPEVPSPSQFNHVISVIASGGKQAWVDTTLETAPFGFLVFAERNVPALVIRGDKATLEITPAETPLRSGLEWTATGDLGADGTLKAKIRNSSRGDNEIVLRSAFRTVPQSQWEKFVQNLSYMSGFAGNVSNVSVSDVDDINTEFNYSYDYLRNNYSDWEHRQIRPPFPASGLGIRDEQVRSDEPQPKKIFLGVPGSVSMDAKINLPPNTVPKLPEDVHLSTDFADFDVDYKYKDGVLYATEKIEIKQAEVPDSRREEVAKFRRSVFDSETAYIVLDGDDEKKVSASDTDAADAAFEEARRALNAQDLGSAEIAVKKLLSIDPSYEDGHLLMATIKYMRGEIAAGDAEAMKEIELNPRNLKAYRTIGFRLMAERKFAEAAKLWRLGTKNMPENADMYGNLASAEQNLDHFDEAFEASAKAFELMPQSTLYRRLYGNGLMRKGRTEEGIKLVREDVEKAGTADALNEFAYILAENNASLDEALRYAQQAVDELERIASHLTADDALPDDLRSMEKLAAYWDTLGWVYYKKADYPSAEKYLKASWQLSPRDVVAEHLGQTYEKQGKTKAAIEIYGYSLGSSAPPPNITARLKKIATAAEYNAATRKANGRLSDLRSISFPRKQSKTASAEYIVELSNGARITGVRSVSGDSDGLQGMDETLKGKQFPAIALPGNQTVKLLRKVMVYCGANTGQCQAVWMPIPILSLSMR